MTVKEDSARQVIALQALGRVAPVGSWCLEVEEDRFTIVLQPPRAIIGGAADLERLVRRPFEVLETEAAVLWSSALESARSTGRPWDLVLESRSHSGAHRWIRTIGRADLQGETVVRLYGVVQDITLLVAVERGLLQLQQQQLVTEVAADLAELQDQLAAIELCEESAVEALPEWHPVQRDLAALAGALAKGREIMEGIVSQCGPSLVMPEPLDLADVIAGIYPSLRRAVGPRILVDLIRTTRLSSALADRAQLEEALLTLTLSARDRMRDRGVLTMITRDVVSPLPLVTLTGVRPAGTFVEVAVSDSGPVLDERARANLFRPCLDNATGVGLLKCLRIVRQFDGVMDAVSSVVGGTTVLLWLPAAPVAEVTIAHSPAKEPA